MAQRAALYRVRVKENYKDYQLLGDIDTAGTALINVLDGYLANFESISADTERVVRCVEHAIDRTELVATLHHGQTGVVADIVSDTGTNRLRQIATDSQNLRCSCLFVLPPERDAGWLAVQVNAGRGIKGLLEAGLRSRFQKQFDDLRLELRPFVNTSALEQAVDAGRVSKVKLIRYERPHDRAVAATNKWVKANEYGKLELDISMRGRGQKLKSDLLKRFFQGDQTAFGDIIEFQGLEFERAKVEVDVEGSTRTFNIETPDSGHPMTIDLDGLKYDADGDPTSESVVNGLRGLVKVVT